MKLEQLLRNIKTNNNISKFKDIDIQKISVNSQDELSNGLFFCYKGSHDIFEMANYAVKNGAKVLVTEDYLNINVAQVLVDDVRQTIGLIAQTFYDTLNIKVIGITGTNGKTTTSFIIKNILEHANKKVGLVGTNGIYFCNKFLPAKLTTPDPIDLHEIFSIMKKGKVDYIVMEVSAHAIDLQKIAGINFVCKILTNLSQDHLDYFKDMTKYQNTKMSFFNKDDLMIINADDSLGQQIIKKYENAISYGLNNPSDAFCIDLNASCNKYVMNISDNVINISSNLYGLFNVYNSLASAVCCYFLGIDIDTIQKGLNTTKSIEGRFNVIEYSDKKIIIDFAHTPDGLENVLKTAKAITQGKLFCLFGCGGDRDKTKRKIMGAVAEKYADFCFVTTDNPRFEEPLSIINDILKGFNKNKYYAIEDRKNAINIAINSLQDGDTLIITGKGGENYIDIKGIKIPYSDFETVKNIIRN